MCATTKPVPAGRISAVALEASPFISHTATRPSAFAHSRSLLSSALKSGPATIAIEKVAVTVAGAFIVTAHWFPEGAGQSVQPSKLEPAAGEAVSVTANPCG